MLKIWDLPTRVYHWLQAALFIGLVSTGYGFLGIEKAHLLFGIVLFVLIIWRIGWGVIGSDTSRFVNFTPSFKQLLLYISGRNKAHIGHNPLGGLMVLLLIMLLLLQAFSGIYLSDIVDGKSLFGRQVIKNFEQFHALNAILLVSCCVIHVFAILVYQLRGKPLIKVMITGYSNTSKHMNHLVFVGNYKAMILLSISITVVLLIIKCSA